MYIKNIEVKNFRTLLDFKMMLDEKYQVIAGANNSGKSNLLRALNIFFNENDYKKELDLPFHIAKGTGSTSPTSIQVDLFLKENEISKIKGLSNYLIDNNAIRLIRYYDRELEGLYHSNQDGSFPIIKDLKSGVNQIKNKTHSIQKLFNRIQFMYIPAQYDISEKINQLVAEEILPTMVDSYGNTGLSAKVKKLKKKIKEVDVLTKEVLKEKNTLITSSFQNVVKDFPEIQAGIDIDHYALDVELTGEGLSDILAKRISLNVKDASHKDVESKGSGIQKLVLITLLKYFSENIESKARYTNPFLIWAIDEPETYMQPKLQKKISSIFKEISQSHQIICTTHSPKMIDVYNPQNVKLFYLENEKFYVTRKEKFMFKKITKLLESDSFGFINKLKEHFGVESNDGWIIKDKNIMFEGNDDIIYFHTTFNKIMGYQLDYSNISSNSSSYMPSYVEFLYQQIATKELTLNNIYCLVDNDEAGLEAMAKINKSLSEDKKIKKYITVYKTISLYLTAEEDKNKNYPSMIEDMAIPEVFYKAIIKFLKAKFSDHTDIDKCKFEDFYEFRTASKRTPIMEVVDNFFSDVISEEEKFSFKNLSVKYALATHYKNIMEVLPEDECLEYITKYKKLKLFFEGFLT